MVDVLEVNNTDHLDSKYGDDMRGIETHLSENSKFKSNGIRDVNKATYVKALEERGVTEAEVRKVNQAIDFVNTAAARVAVTDLENKISETSADDLKNDEARRGLSSTVRLATLGGSTEITVSAETVNPIPFKADADGNGERQYKTTYGRLRTSINTKGRIHPNFAEEANDRIRSALGIKD